MQKKLFENILRLRYKFPQKYFPSLAKDFIIKVLRISPKKRLTLVQMENHAWIKSKVPEKFKK